MIAQRPLHGRVALVTGGSRGVGRGIALRLAADGAAVAVNYRRDAEAAADVVDRIRVAGGQAVAVRASISEPEAIAAMVEAIHTSLGAVDLLVSNAGTASSGRTVAESDPVEFVRLLDVHTLGPLDLIRQLLPNLRAADRGDIVMISSALTDSAPANGAPYALAKQAMELAVRTVAREERIHGVRANIVAPGLVATDMGERLVAATTNGGDIASLESRLPFGRACRPDDVAAAVAFLVGPGGEYVTGQRIVVDGGGPDVSILHQG